MLVPLPSHDLTTMQLAAALNAGGLESMAATNSGEEKKVRPEIEGIQPISPQEVCQFLLLNLKSRRVELAPLTMLILSTFCFCVPAVY